MVPSSPKMSGQNFPWLMSHVMSHDHSKRSLSIISGFVCFHVFSLVFYVWWVVTCFELTSPQNGPTRRPQIGQAGLRDEVQALGYRTRGGPEDAGALHVGTECGSWWKWQGPVFIMKQTAFFVSFIIFYFMFDLWVSTRWQDVFRIVWSLAEQASPCKILQRL